MRVIPYVLSLLACGGTAPLPMPGRPCLEPYRLRLIIPRPLPRSSWARCCISIPAFLDRHGVLLLLPQRHGRRRRPSPGLRIGVHGQVGGRNAPTVVAFHSVQFWDGRRAEPGGTVQGSAGQPDRNGHGQFRRHHRPYPRHSRLSALFQGRVWRWRCHDHGQCRQGHRCLRAHPDHPEQRL